MSTHTLNPPASSALQPAPEKVFVVCAKFPFPTHGAPALYYEMLGGEFFHRLLCSELKAAGIQFSEPMDNKTTGLLRRAYADFRVRDVAAATRAVAPILKKWSAFFVIGYQDEREGIYRALWPEKPAFDLNRYLPELFAAIIRDAPEQKAMISQYVASLRAYIPPTEPPPAPAA